MPRRFAKQSNGPNMRFVPIKTEAQQAVLALHRTRSLLVRQRTATINAIRGLLGEFGLVAAKGPARLDELRRRLAMATAEQIPPGARCETVRLDLSGCLVQQLVDQGRRRQLRRAKIEV